MFHKESNGVTSFSATEVLPDLLGWRYRKARRTLIGKGTESLVTRARTLELDKVAYNFLHPNGIIYFVYAFFSNHVRKGLYFV